jgi:hypothetical protein
LTLWGQAARLLRHSQLDVNWGAWATLALCLAPLPFLAQVAVFVLLRDRPEYGPVAISVTLATVALLLFSVFFGKRASLRAVVPEQRRRNLSVWLGNFIGLVLVALTILRVTHPTTPEEWFVIYPLWLIVAGCTFFSQAANAGFLYVNGILCFLLAVLAPLVLFYMPLIGGVLLWVNLTTLGLLLRRVAREAKAQ